MSPLCIHLLRKSNPTSTYYAIHLCSLGPRKKIATMKIDGAGTRTITKQPGRTLQAAERRLIKAFQPI